MDEHKGQTDEIHRIELPSAIEQVTWTRRMAVPGGAVGLEVFTRYVGHGAELQIKLTDHRGRTHGTFRDQLYANRLTAEILVPSSAREALFAEVKLPQHGLKQTSPPLLLTPPVEITDAKWEKSKTFQGDVLTLRANVRGLPDGAEVEVQVWAHDPKDAHELLTRFPALVESGRVEVQWECWYHEPVETMLAAIKQNAPPSLFYCVRTHGVQVESDLIQLRWLLVELVGEDDRPISDERYQIEFADGSVREGKLDAEGRVFLFDIESEGAANITFPDLDGEAWEKV